MAELVERVCPICGIIYGLEKRFYEYRRNGSASQNEKSWYCPNGHSLVITETTADKLRRENQRLLQNTAYLEDNVKWQREARERAERSAVAYKGQATRLRNRSKAGVCPCCNRTFKQLAAHMATKHPGFAVDPDTALPADVAPVLKVVGGVEA